MPGTSGDPLGWDHHVILGDHEVPAGTVVQRDVVCTGTLLLGEGARLEGDATAGGSIRLEAGARIQGNAYAVETVHMGPRSRVAGDLGSLEAVDPAAVDPHLPSCNSSP